MYLDYLKDRYEDTDFLPLTLEEVANDFEKLVLKDSMLLKTEEGFISYEMQGDAVIIYDIFIRPEYRQQLAAQELGAKVLAEARMHGKRVAIGFSEFGGKNHEFGMRAMKRAGFQPAHQTSSNIVFFKGL